MLKGYLKLSLLLGALSVALGAFGAHALKKMVSIDAVSIYETAVRYQFYHVFALMAAAILHRGFPGKLMKIACAFFVAGIIFFCGSLYALTAIRAMVVPGYDYIGAITPVGGLAFIAGWLAMLIAVFRSRQELIQKP